MSKEKTANDHQIGGQHYRESGVIQHWDFAASNNFDYFQGQITKYVTRWKKKRGIEDLRKAAHFLEKYIELETQKIHGKELVGAPPNKPYRSTGMHHPFGYTPEDEE